MITESIKSMIRAKDPSAILEEDFTLWCIVFPELERAAEIRQRNKQTILDHTICVLSRIKTKNLITILSAITHDLGKVNTRTIDRDGTIHFAGHQHDSASIVRTRLRDIDFNPDITGAVVRIVRNHMYDIKNLRQKQAIERFIAAVGPDNLDSWFELRTADSFAYLPQEVEIEAHHYQETIIAPFRKRIDDVLDSNPEEYKYEDIMQDQ